MKTLDHDQSASVVIHAYTEGKISLAKAAETLEMSRIEFERELQRQGIQVRTLSPEDVRAEVQAIASW